MIRIRRYYKEHEMELIAYNRKNMKLNTTEENVAKKVCDRNGH